MEHGSTMATRKINALSATSPDDVWAVGGADVDGEPSAAHEPLVLHRTGGSWLEITPLEIFNNHVLRGVWASSATRVYIVGEQGLTPPVGKLFLFNGTRWDELLPESSVASYLPFNSVHGTSGNDVWVVGRQGALLNYNGVGWRSLSSGVPFSLFSVFTLPDGSGWCGGNSGAILRLP
jgi:hypothetical protein